MKRPDTKKTIDNDEKPYRINPQYVCDLETYCEELEKALDKAIVSLTFADHLLGVGKSTYSYDQWKNWLLKELVDEEEKYRWHDLRKDPNDLPKENTRVLVIYKFWESHPSYTVARLAKRTYANVWIENGNAEFSSGMVFAWKYIKGLDE